MSELPKALTVQEVLDIYNNPSHKLTILDVRKGYKFLKFHIKNAIFALLHFEEVKLENIDRTWTDENYPKLTSYLIPKNSSIVLIAEPEDLAYAYKLLIEYKFTGILGYMDGSIEDWRALGGPTDGINGVNVDEVLDMDFSEGSGNVLMDVRTKDEWDEDGVNGVAKLLDLMNVPFIQSLDESKLYFVYCCEGSRSLMVASYLVTLGYNVSNVIGGCDEMISKGGKMVTYKDSQLMKYNDDNQTKWKLKGNEDIAENIPIKNYPKGDKKACCIII